MSFTNYIWKHRHSGGAFFVGDCSFASIKGGTGHWFRLRRISLRSTFVRCRTFGWSLSSLSRHLSVKSRMSLSPSGCHSWSLIVIGQGPNLRLVIRPESLVSSHPVTLIFPPLSILPNSLCSMLPALCSQLFAYDFFKLPNFPSFHHSDIPFIQLSISPLIH